MKLKELNNLDEGLIGVALISSLILKYGIAKALAIKAGLVTTGVTLTAVTRYLNKKVGEWDDKKQEELIKQWKEQQDLDKTKVVTEGDVVKFPTAPDALEVLKNCKKCNFPLTGAGSGKKICMSCLTIYSNEPKIKNTPNNNKGLTRIK
jgi:hypothetical protein